jgi:hypothetical protein
LRQLIKDGTPKAEIMAKIAITTINSINVKPDLFLMYIASGSYYANSLPILAILRKDDSALSVKIIELIITD